MSRVLALDLEAVPTTEPPAFDMPSEWTVFAVSLSFRSSASSPPETVVFVRRDGTAREARKLLCATANWVQDKRPIDTMLTYNGGDLEGREPFDLGILDCHIDEIEATHPDLAAFIRSALSIDHRDLFDGVKAGLADHERWPSLEAALRSRGIESPTTRLDETVIDGSLMPAIGRRVLDPDTTLGEHEERALRKYAASDVAPLHELACCLDREREQRIAAEAEATAGGES